jgi:hypothetical protein
VTLAIVVVLVLVVDQYLVVDRLQDDPYWSTITQRLSTLTIEGRAHILWLFPFGNVCCQRGVSSHKFSRQRTTGVDGRNESGFLYKTEPPPSPRFSQPLS